MGTVKVIQKIEVTSRLNRSKSTSNNPDGVLENGGFVADTEHPSIPAGCGKCAVVRKF